MNNMSRAVWWQSQADDARPLTWKAEIFASILGTHTYISK